MPQEISPETFQHLVQLAALELDEAEAEYLLAELNKQLQAIEELAAIPLDAETPATSHGVPYAESIRPPLRPDEAIPDPDVEAIKGQAPEMDDEYIVVPDIPREDLS